MAYFPDLPVTETSVLMTDVFLGINKDLSIADGEFSDMTNMTSDAYPVLSTRRERTLVGWNNGDSAVSDPQGLVVNDKLAVIDGGTIYLDGEPVQGVTLSSDAEMQPKHIVCMGAYICVWPDKKYVNTANPDDCGDMGTAWAAGGAVSAVMCRKDGTDYDMESITASDDAPQDPSDGQMWIDTSGDNDVLKQYSAIYNEWVQVATTYIKLQAPGIGKGLKESDAPHISGAAVAAGVQTASEGASGTIDMPTEDFRLSSSFNTSLGTDGRINATTPTKPTRTKTFTVEGIPSGAVVKKSTLSFHAGSPKYGARIFTVNGKKADIGNNSMDAGVTGNGEYSYKFVFQPYTGGATTIGSQSSTVLVTDILLTVEYATGSGEGETTEEQVVKQIEALNTTNILYGAGDDYIIVAGLLRRGVTLADTLTVELRVPDLEYVCEAGNRIWGCRFAKVNGELVNEIRCCALGDFRNWYLFEGTSMDSYVVSVGSAGPFTGAFALKGSPLFFKENAMHRVSGTQPSNFTLNTTQCRGVQDGCWRSLVQVNEALYYKARTDVMAYDGSVPYPVSEKLDAARYADASAGSFRDKYYISMHDDDVRWHLFVFDTKRGLWHREDDSKVCLFAETKGSLFFIRENEDTPVLLCAGDADGGKEGAFGWSATFGTFGYQQANQKYLSRFNIRAQMAPKSWMKMEIMYDSDGIWEDEGTIRCATFRTFMIPVIPRRCDHCKIRLSGNGGAKIYSIARILDVGGDG